MAIPLGDRVCVAGVVSAGRWAATLRGGVLNISHRVPFEDLARRVPGAILTFLPGAPQEQLQYGEYVKYFGSKARAGVVKLDDNDALYVVPPTAEAAMLLKSLEAHHGATVVPALSIARCVAGHCR